jgi:hypothetical protein
VKLLLIAFLLTVVGTLIYLRLRPYLAFARRLFGVVRTARRLNVNDLSSSSTTTNRAPVQTNEPLVRCASCGTWLPASRALIFRATNDAYCSAACMERAAGGRDDRRTTASRQ